jgi:hypothetical protein
MLTSTHCGGVIGAIIFWEVLTVAIGIGGLITLVVCIWSIDQRKQNVFFLE